MKLSIIILKITVFLLILSNLLSCNEEQEKSKIKTAPLVLKIFNWEDYLGSETIEKFTIDTGISVQLDHYEDEEDMFAYIRSDLSAYDLVVASDDLVREMIAAKTLSKLDLGKIKNIQNIDSRFLNMEFDPQQDYSIPYLWGTTGMVVNTKYIMEHNNSWSILFDEKYVDKTAMLNNSFETLAAPLKIMGKSINESDALILQEAAELLYKQNKELHGYYDATTIMEMLIEEQLWAAQIYSGEGMSAVDENDDLLYIIPNEGAPIWLDNFVVPRDAENIESAHLFLDFILDPVINAEIASELWYATANKEALQYINQEVLDSESVFPSEETLKRCEYYEDNGSAVNLISEIWSNLHDPGFN